MAKNFGSLWISDIGVRRATEGAEGVPQGNET